MVCKVIVTCHISPTFEERRDQINGSIAPQIDSPWLTSCSPQIRDTLQWKVGLRICHPEDFYAISIRLGWQVLQKAAASPKGHQLLVHSHIAAWDIMLGQVLHELVPHVTERCKYVSLPSGSSS